MQNREANTAAGRVVVLSRDEAFCASAGTAQFLRVGNAYEAVAELLAAPCAALVIDLRTLNLRHVRLLEIARDSGAEILACGPLPSGISSELLGGVRLVSESRLREELAGLTETPSRAASLPEPPPTDKPRLGAEEERTAQNEFPVPQADRPPIASAHGLRPVSDRAPVAAAPAQPSDEEVAANLLTTAELEALLENEP